MKKHELSLRHFLFGALLLFLLVSQLLWLAEPWSNSLGGVTSGFYYGYSCRTFESLGFFELRFQPSYFFVAESKEFFKPYLNHPPWPYMAVYPAYLLGGGHEWAMRIPGLMLLVGAALALIKIAHSRQRGDQALWALAFFVSMPMLFEYGNMVDAPLYSMAFLAFSFGAYARYQNRRGTKAYLIYFACALLAGMMDWFGYFLVPALWLSLIHSGRKQKALRLSSFCKAAFAIGLPFGIALIVNLAWLAWATGGLAGLGEQVDMLLGVPLGDESLDHLNQSSYVAEMSKNFVNMFGWPLIIAALWGGLQCFLRPPAKRVPLDGAGFLLLAGLLPAIVFYTRAMEHEFWILVAAPGAAFMAAKGLVSINPRFALALAVLACGFQINSGLDLRENYRTNEFLRQGQALNTAANARDVVLSYYEPSPARFYIQAAVIPEVRTPEGFRKILEQLKLRRDHFDKLFVLWPLDATTDYAWVQKLPRTSKSAWRGIEFGGNKSVIVQISKKACFAALPTNPK